jgi:tetratricopeptide (TPR) repeat protein
VKTAQRRGRRTQLSKRALSTQFDLLERDAELAEVEALISANPSGGRLLAIEGPPGIGKTSLLMETKARGEAAGMRVLAARGSELERAFSYGVVRQLFEAFLASLPPDERAGALAGAGALAAPLLDPAQLAAQPSADSSLATLHGLYWLTANVAASRPLLLAIDDLHWCDLPSLRWLAYVLPRMEGLGLWIVISLRHEDPGEDPSLLVQIVSDPLATVIRPAPLSRGAAARFVRRTLSPDADHAFCAACQEETGGNPLLLRELMLAIAAEGLAPTEPNVPRLRELGARAGSRAVTIRLSRLPPESRRLAQAVSILGDDADPRQAAALADLDVKAASEAAGALARVDILRPQPLLGFIHPIIRAAVYQALTPLEREIGHARAAAILGHAGAEPERIAAHLLRCPAAADSAVVAVLREAARHAASRGDSESAVAYLRRAVAEPPSAVERADLLCELGSAEALVSGNAAVEHLREAHALTVEPVRKAETALVLGRELFFLLRSEESDAVFTEALGELAGADAELGRLLEAGLITNAMHVRRLHRGALARLERIRSRPGDGTIGEKILLSLLAYHDARAGASAAVAIPLARRALAEGALVRTELSSAAFVPPCMVLAMADLDDALAIYDDALTEAHRRGSVITFATTKTFRAQAYVLRGDLAEAEAEGREAFAAAEAWGRPLAPRCTWPPFSQRPSWSRASSTRPGLRSIARASVSPYLKMRACSFSLTSGRACACSPAIWSAAWRTCSMPVAILTHSEIATRPLWRGARMPPSPCSSSATRTRPAAWPRKSSSSRAPGVLPARSARRCGQRDWPKEGREASGFSRRRSTCSRPRRRSSSTRRRLPSWGRHFAGPTAAPRRASSCDVRSSWQQSAAPGPSRHAPTPNFAPPGRGHGASPLAVSNRSRQASGALPRWRPKAQPTGRSRKSSSSPQRRSKSTSQASTASSGSARARSFRQHSPNLIASRFLADYHSPQSAQYATGRGEPTPP